MIMITGDELRTLVQARDVCETKRNQLPDTSPEKLVAHEALGALWVLLRHCAIDVREEDDPK
jgi:hypothetical protein